MTLQQRFSQFYQRLDIDSLDQLDGIYSESVLFEDPVAVHDGLSALDLYFRKLLAGCSGCTFDIDRLHFGDSQGHASWRMTFSSPRLNGGRDVTVEGVSLLLLDQDRISYQRDYYDMGAMVYEQLPVLRNVVRHIRGRMAA